MLNIKNGNCMIRRYSLLLFIVSISCTVYALRVDNVVGMFRDDAWYALLGKAIASGNGYSLINAPNPGITPIYPPFFPFLLSLVFRAIPAFPENLFYLKLVSIMAMFGAGILAYIYFKQGECSHKLSIILAQLVVLSPGLVFIATSSLMSECVFTLVCLGSIVMVEHVVTDTRVKSQYPLIILAGVLLSATFLTRSIAITLLISSFLYLVMKRKMALLPVFALTTALIIGSWLIYSRIHRPTLQQRAEVNSYILVPYSEHFWDRTAGLTSEGKITIFELPARIVSNIVSVITLDLGGVVIPSFFPALNQGLAERYHQYQTVISLLALLLVTLGYLDSIRSNLTLSEIFTPFYILVVLAWPFPPYRFLLPILPIFLLYLIRGWRRVIILHSRLLLQGLGSKKINSENSLIGMAFVLLIFTVYSNTIYINRKFSTIVNETPKWIRIFDETEQILNWVKFNTSKDSRIATENPALVHLYSGNKTVTYDNPTQNWELWKNLSIRYYVSVLPGQSSANNSNFKLVYNTSGPIKLKVLDFDLPESRKSSTPVVK